MSDDATCIHEAAHAVIGHLLGERPRTVTVLGDRCGWTISGVPVDGDRQDRMVVLLAGRTAARAAGFDVGRPDSSDERRARGIALQLAKWPASDDVGLETAAWILRHAERRTAQLVARHREAIASFAAALRANGGRLGGDEVRDALRAASVRSTDLTATPATTTPTDVDFARVVLELHRGRAANWRLLGLLGGSRARLPRARPSLVGNRVRS
jgi:hypothetical protein